MTKTIAVKEPPAIKPRNINACSLISSTSNHDDIMRSFTFDSQNTRLKSLVSSQGLTQRASSFVPSRSLAQAPRLSRYYISSSCLLPSKHSLFSPIALYREYPYKQGNTSLLVAIERYPEMSQLDDSRKLKGLDIAKSKTILENTDGSFSVPSQSVEEIAYLVRVIDGKYVCNCLDFKYKEERAIQACKHIHAVSFWIAHQVELKQAPKPKIFADDSIQCVKCGSIRVIKYGTSHGKQAFKCNDCLHRFRESNILKRARYTPEMVSLTLDLYFSGTSLRKITRIVNAQFGLKLGATSVYRWIQKYIPKISSYVNQFAPQVSETWHADEVFVPMKNGIRVKGKT